MSTNCRSCRTYFKIEKGVAIPPVTFDDNPRYRSSTVRTKSGSIRAKAQPPEPKPKSPSLNRNPPQALPEPQTRASRKPEPQESPSRLGKPKLRSLSAQKPKNRSQNRAKSAPPSTFFQKALRNSEKRRSLVTHLLLPTPAVETPLNQLSSNSSSFQKGAHSRRGCPQQLRFRALSREILSRKKRSNPRLLPRRPNPSLLNLPRWKRNLPIADEQVPSKEPASAPKQLPKKLPQASNRTLPPSQPLPTRNQQAQDRPSHQSREKTRREVLRVQPIPRDSS